MRILTWVGGLLKELWLVDGGRSVGRGQRLRACGGVIRCGIRGGCSGLLVGRADASALVEGHAAGLLVGNRGCGGRAVSGWVADDLGRWLSVDVDGRLEVGSSQRPCCYSGGG